MPSANPAFNNPAFQDQSAVRSYPGGAQAANIGGSSQNAAFAQQAQAASVNAHLEGQFAAPSAGAVETDRMTVEDTVWKTVGLFGILVVTAVVGWFWSMSTVTATSPTPTMIPWIVGLAGGFILAMVISFSKTVRPPLIFAYAALEGLFIGSISAFFEIIWPGIVLQATLGTLSVVGVTLALFASGKIRASKRATKIWMIAMIGYLVFSLINVGMMMFGAFPADSGGAFGMLSNVQVFGIPLGLIIGVFVVIMAAYSLVQDFDFIQQGVRNRAPRKYGWLGGFGIMVTVVWLYIEILRIIAIARSN
ncbi:Bax inhibitor-1/YccA family protein [Microbacterium horticulturae]|uniref:Bax inhibitor-1/YccA family protein n=1 Tax=Microbacterium horticulturae TaxID=3028316 RepID=A0ABY8BV93_9MICO|nr:Bax inhibitor-1/YccA family protein [Microbacterium sp. KACC 23027]WEG08094.1 Bax inhibitor-1/YccA family protein [Microbacterium sp. KACC 23027]